VAAATRDELERIIALIEDEQVRVGIAWRSLGYTQAEAALRAGLTEKALERRLGRVRAKIKQAQASWAVDQEGGAAR
jgi:DNA-directed RNA polymerase specialized sigma24 family protein